jgi:hypothetical protein
VRRGGRFHINASKCPSVPIPKSVANVKSTPLGQSNYCDGTAFALGKECVVSQSNSLRKLKLVCTRLAADCMQSAGDVYGPAFQSRLLRMVRAWPILIQVGEAPATAILAKRVQRSKQETLSPPFRPALTPMALVRKLKKLRQENRSLRRRLLRRAD